MARITADPCTVLSNNRSIDVLLMNCRQKGGGTAIILTVRRLSPESAKAMNFITIYNYYKLIIFLFSGVICAETFSRKGLAMPDAPKLDDLDICLPESLDLEPKNECHVSHPPSAFSAACARRRAGHARLCFNGWHRGRCALSPTINLYASPCGNAKPRK
jgi:hypothetical protein